MTTIDTSGRPENSGPATVAFGARLASSQAFSELFRDGMALVEETASYLDGAGRNESRSLERHAALAYATESMRLTTRLMQLASWLLLQRAVNEGEITSDQAQDEKSKVRLTGLGSPTPQETLAELPEALQSLIAKTMRLQERVSHLDRLISAKPAAEPAVAANNPLASTLDRLQEAFGGRR